MAEFALFGNLIRLQCLRQWQATFLGLEIGDTSDPEGYPARSYGPRHPYDKNKDTAWLLDGIGYTSAKPASSDDLIVTRLTITAEHPVARYFRAT